MKKFYMLLSTVMLSLMVICSSALAQDYTVTGQVTDAITGDGIAGVNVVVKGTTQGTITDSDGKYSISVSKSPETLLFSFIGYRSVEMQVTSASTNLNVQLEEDITNLEEVVVTGLASSIKRANLANAVSTVSGKDLSGATNVQTLDYALQGKLTGANIIANSGAPGGGMSVKLRGITTITGSSEPLYIVDGVYIDNSAISAGTNPITQANTTAGTIATTQDNPSNRIADLNPDDIENIEILKGASAAAIYGARANAGVIIITTKKGNKGKTKISFSQTIGQASILNPLGVRDFSTDTQNKIFGIFGSGARGNTELALYNQAKADGKIYDYEDVMYGNKGFLTNTSLSLSGGNDKTSFFLSGSLKDEEGIIKGTGFTRNSIRANVDHKISNIFDLSFNTNYVHSTADRGLTNNDNAGVSFGVALSSTVPWADLFPDDNGIYPANIYAASNPVETRDRSTIHEETNRIITGGTLNVNLINKNNTFLKAVFRGGIDYYNNETFVYFPEDLQFMVGGLEGFVSKGNNVTLNRNLSSFLVFTKNLPGVELTSQIGATSLIFEQQRNTVQAIQLIGGQTALDQAGALSAFNKRVKTIDYGYSFQQEANFQDKIIATAGIRLDKSSLNGDPNELFLYPKVSAAANLHNFTFWNFDVINQFKVRAAYGEAGGVPSPGLVTLTQPAFTVFNGANVSGLSGSLISATRGNDQIKPERSKELEFGIDVAFMNNRISLEATYYKKNVTDLILIANQPGSSGFGFKTVNGGEIENKGIELAMNITAVNSEKVRWTFRPSFWKNKSKVVDLDVPAFITGGFSTALGAFKIEEGKSLTQIVGTKPGVDGDVVLGDATPDFQMAFTNTVTFLKNFEFNMLWHWKKGGDNLNLTQLLTDFGGVSYDYDKIVRDPISGDEMKKGDYRITSFLTGNTGAFVQDASYWKLREISLYYNIPTKVYSRLFNGAIERIRVGVSGNNLILISNYNSYDPEVSNFGNNGISSGVEVTPFPSSKRFFFHLNINF